MKEINSDNKIYLKLIRNELNNINIKSYDEQDDIM